MGSPEYNLLHVLVHCDTLLELSVYLFLTALLCVALQSLLGIMPILLPRVHPRLHGTGRAKERKNMFCKIFFDVFASAVTPNTQIMLVIIITVF